MLVRGPCLARPCRHVPSGRLRYRFLQCHGDKRITALAFDAAKRRLITGAEDGDCKARGGGGGGEGGAKAGAVGVCVWGG